MSTIALVHLLVGSACITLALSFYCVVCKLLEIVQVELARRMIVHTSAIIICHAWMHKRCLLARTFVKELIICFFAIGLDQ